MNKKFYNTVEKFDDSTFKPLPYKRRLMCGENISQARSNLWSMFKLKFSKDEIAEFHKTKYFPFGANVSDYGWTKEVSDAFYDHPYHKSLFNKLRKCGGMDYGMWKLMVEPTIIGEE